MDKITTEFDVIYDEHVFSVKIDTAQQLFYQSSTPYCSTFHRISIRCETAEVNYLPSVGLSDDDRNIEEFLVKQFIYMLRPHNKDISAHYLKMYENEERLYDSYISKRDENSKNIPYFNVNTPMPEVPAPKQESNNGFSEKIREWFK